MNDINVLWSTIIPSWLTAIGTIGAVCISLFYRPLICWIKRPKLVSSINNATPYIEEIISSPESSEKEKETRIRLEITNKGKITADHCTISVSCYYKKRDKDDIYCKTTFAPIQIKDYRCSSLTYISPNVSYFLDIASIRRIDEMGSSSDGNLSHQFYKLMLLGDGKPLKLGKGTFIIPINISSPRMRTHIVYLKVYWVCDNYCLDKEHFSIDMLSESEFNSLIIK